LTGSAERFDEPVKALAFHSASTPSVQFTRFIYEGEIGVSFWRDPRTLRFYARVEDQTGTDHSGVFLLSDLATLGGKEGLSGFEPGRFHDADLMLGRITYIYPLARYLEMDLHTEAGSVMPKLADAQVSVFEASYGLAVRVRSPFAPLASAGVDWSRETIRFRFSLGGVE
jgi:outer membrane protein assembly factor BamA